MTASTEQLEVNLDDCVCRIEATDHLRRKLIHHLTAWIKEQIRAAIPGANPDDGELFKQDVIEDYAWRLARSTLTDAEAMVRDMDTGIPEFPSDLFGPIVLGCLAQEKKTWPGSMEWTLFLGLAVDDPECLNLERLLPRWAAQRPAED